MTFIPTLSFFPNIQQTQDLTFKQEHSILHPNTFCCWPQLLWIHACFLKSQHTGWHRLSRQHDSVISIVNKQTPSAPLLLLLLWFLFFGIVCSYLLSFETKLYWQLSMARIVQRGRSDRQYKYSGCGSSVRLFSVSTYMVSFGFTTYTIYSYSRSWNKQDL